jgi:hypothetical protein
MNPDHEEDHRKLPDRRREPTRPWDALLPAGRRMLARRGDEHRRHYFVDRFSGGLLALIVTILVSCVLDAMLTVHLLGAGAEEINPLMNHLLQRGILSFLIGKYVLTSVGLLLLLVFKNYYLFGTRIRVGYWLPAIAAGYFALIAYQAWLIVGSGG